VNTVREIYESTVRQLPAVDRLKLASFILDDLAASNGKGLDMSDDWSDEDMADLAAASLKHANQAAPNVNGDA